MREQNRKKESKKRKKSMSIKKGDQLLKDRYKKNRSKERDKRNRRRVYLKKEKSWKDN